MRASLPHLRASRGSITAVTSAGLYRFPSRDVLSVAPKAAIEALVRAVAKEEGRSGVRANCVALGVIEAGNLNRLSGAGGAGGGASGELGTGLIAAAKRNTPLPAVRHGG